MTSQKSINKASAITDQNIELFICLLLPFLFKMSFFELYTCVTVTQPILLLFALLSHLFLSVLLCPPPPCSLFSFYHSLNSLSLSFCHLFHILPISSFPFIMHQRLPLLSTSIKAWLMKSLYFPMWMNSHSHSFNQFFFSPLCSLACPLLRLVQDF